MALLLARASRAAAMLALGGSAALGAQVPAPAGGSAPTIVVVTGRAESTVPADRATLTVAVETRGKTAAEAGAQNASVIERVRAALRGAEVSAAQMTTAGFTVAQEYRYDQGPRGPVPTGYVARNAVRLELTKLDGVGRLIDVALGAGANHVDDLQFGATSTAEARRSALTEAIANARADATTIARAAGGSLGRLLEVSTEWQGGPRIPVQYDVASRRSPAPSSVDTLIDARTIRVVAVVLTRWQLVAAP